MSARRNRASPSIGVIVVTWRARALLERCLAPVLRSPRRPRVLVVNSSSQDGTVELAHGLGCETWVVPRASFNHGLTREAARKRLGVDVVLMLTPDCVMRGPEVIDLLVEPIASGRAAVAYARQVAGEGADPLARFGRAFAFPPTSEIRGLEDAARLGAAVAYCSNACAAWSNVALDRIGGFKATLVSEETIALCELLARGEKVAYVAEAVVEHGHPTRLLDDFRRQFDIGWTREAWRHLLLAFGPDERRGLAYLRALLREIGGRTPLLLPWALLDTLVRYLGYRTGRLAYHLPSTFARAFSSQDFFWLGQGHELVRRAVRARATRDLSPCA
ncbi:MAG: glycosyltransferase [Geminicoccaceae bacterium]|nr:glycosyltransferase [Geminicoccaceae bacterium]MCS7266900.1 glycosyltransferase [Geminicoccaceae bacterium]MCX7628835.1 glycosyltransferase [Geminicoccaceae bacterium]MDW8124176.1 glycosyltransferase [Geminicoccaceae bacterium]MDW8340601.1 glycosyltransferase [Geminicoccaceae bacterium]